MFFTAELSRGISSIKAKGENNRQRLEHREDGWQTLRRNARMKARNTKKSLCAFEISRKSRTVKGRKSLE